MSFKTKKSLGQHFLTDKNIVFKIIDAIVAEKSDRIIEIGPGTGALTKWLVEKFDDVHAIEIDQRAVEVLKEEVKNLTLHEKDVLKIDWNEMIDPAKQNIVVGNLPYYITTPILFALLENRTIFSEAILMMQKEVAERLVSAPSSKQYGILSVQTQLFCTPEILFEVSRNSFSPPPKVTSAVIKLKFDKPQLSFSDQTLKSIVRTAFNQRRKKLSNSLKPVLGDYQPEGFNFDDRAEHWSPQIYAKLAEHLEQTDKLS
ncbi:MAG: ribosomal RNA small subunit methyltransferase A [Gracilimonas sp.]|uniref:16S rRNA (adenine(1518)-N(6)/adenine(1519)-N(6))- dimethyltransferase RsmA n=1 Tax=Gracilimonas sp. TaxID=1974203 RepID=UPI0019BE3014|nr:16S rRNA (adenine(1518)-N(6)/adenine(1519)-N(6))-dimethyltransferase RsmA [Gracilimonas sp.]MBD3615154.1 ribosomal RNA small subunit methyltransferase A [Gracilimonas sp.]